MGTATPSNGRPRDGAIDVDAEMNYWRKELADSLFYEGEPFRHYKPTLEFAYGMYLATRGAPLAEVVEALRQRYETDVVMSERVRWDIAHQVLAAVWQRLAASDRRPLHPQPARASFRPTVRTL